MNTHQIEKELWEAADQLRANSKLTAAVTGQRLLPEDTVDLFYESKKYIFDSIRNAGPPRVLTSANLSDGVNEYDEERILP